ncbi:hypothetical protein [Collimonas sp.]|jgi:hypothetical protein|uniref:hypothetical protein n=1 Tax=Collimonas sp. TaxID=1963772 RepID=UPI002CCCBA6D|nr:hypothetical protein [Collimonas sp.]HWW08168.1 hypothetical protein [Collimonas sp.]
MLATSTFAPPLRIAQWFSTVGGTGNNNLIHMALAAEMAATTEQAAWAVSVADIRQTAAVVITPEPS